MARPPPTAFEMSRTLAKVMVLSQVSRRAKTAARAGTKAGRSMKW